MVGVKRKNSRQLSTSSAKLARISTSSSSASTPTLRRAPTMEIKSGDSSPTSSLRKSASKRKIMSVASLSKTASLLEGDFITSVTSLPSGSSFGKTANIASSDGKFALKKSDSITTSTSSLGKRKSDREGTLMSTSSKLSKTDMSKETTIERRLSKSLSKTGSITVLKSKSSSKLSSVSSLKKTTSGTETELAGMIDELRKSTSSVGTAAPPTLFLPPGGLMEIVFSFDTTGSMCSCLNQVRGSIQDMVQRLQADIPGIRIGIVAHGDYCDEANYIIQWIDFGSDVPEICKFVKNISSTGGGDGDECYELVLRRAQEVFSWTPGSQRSLVIIGDAHPHEKGYSYKTHHVDTDWRDHVYQLRDMGIRIYSVQASGLSDLRTNAFYENMAKATGGKHVQLDAIASIFDIMMSICYREGGTDLFMTYEAEMRARPGGGVLGNGLEGVLDELRDPSSSVPKSGLSTFIIPPAGPNMFTGSLFPPAATPLFGGTTGLFGTTLSPKRKKASKCKPAKTKKAIKIAKMTPKKTKASMGKKTPKAGKKTATTSKAKVTKKTQAKQPKQTIRKTKTAIPTKKKTQKQKKTNKKKKQVIVRRKRETVTGDKLGDKLEWSPWVLAMAPTKPSVRARGWKPCSWKNGVRFKNMWDRNTNIHAVYEFAVQIPGKKKMHPVYIRPSRGFPPNTIWDAVLLRIGKLKAAVKDVISRGGKLFARRGTGTFLNVTNTSTYLLKNFCYAWRVSKNGKKKYRDLKKQGFVLSHSEIN